MLRPDLFFCDDSEIIGLLAELVRIPSHSGIDRQEEKVVWVLKNYLEKHGFETACEEVVPGRPNLLCTWRSKFNGRHLLLCGHTDTVPLNEGNPGVGYSAKIEKGKMYGRGTADMKGALAAMAICLAALKKSGALKKGAVTFAAVIDEEMQSLGAERLIKSGFQADGAIVGEPTGNRLCLGHKGLEWLEIIFHGRAAHGGTPEAGINAIAAASEFVRLVNNELGPLFKTRNHPLLGPPTVNFGTIKGGDQPSTVAASCRLTADRRSVPGENFETICAELRGILAGVESQMPGLKTEIRRLPGGMATMDHLPLSIHLGHPLAQAVKEAVESAGRVFQEPGAFPAWTDGALLANFAHIPTVILGPGELSTAHSPGECVSLDEVVQAARIYAASALCFC
ncbi:MAG: M20 family metallopeptidase [Elusimicrobia bacterium]|nr:M20 family metallopeptidase [Elusimicrobiota bacterium]